MDPTTQTLAILLVGIVVVVGGVLVFRLHAFLALVLGALCVSALTPTAAVRNYALSQKAVKVLSTDEASGEVRLQSKNKLVSRPGTVLAVLRQSAGKVDYEEVGTLRVGQADGVKEKTSNEFPATFTPNEGITAFQPATDLVLHPVDVKAADSLASQTIGERVADGFGSTCGKIGILIAMASIIGKCLLDSGAADRIVRTALGWFGEKGAPFAFMSSGFALGIPVFFDTVFYLMIPLGKAMQMRTGRNYLLYVLAIVSGATMAHSLVPPTPGPLFVAEQLGVDIGTMILAGCIVGVFTSGFGYFYAQFANRIWTLPLRESPEFSLEDLEQLSQKDESELPPFWLSLLPIVLPVVLIAGHTIIEPFSASLPGGFMGVAETLGNKNIALVVSAAIAMGTLLWQKRTTFQELAEAVQASLASGGVIILITAGGGAFGGVLKQTGVASLITDMPQSSPVMICTLAFLITAAIRTAQGSATVAMITSVGILSGLATSGQLGFHPVYLGMAIGCGSKPVAWMNDSGFWVIGKMSGMTEAETLKYVTPMTTLMGVVGLAVTLIGVTILPMAK